MSQTIAVFGAGPGLGQAVARRYGQAGYEVVLVARRQEPLERFAEELAAAGITAHVVTGDLSDSDAVPALAERIRAKAGSLNAFYYGPAPADPGFVAATTLLPEQARELMPKTLYSLLALVQEFLPAMLDQGSGAILSAQGAAAMRGLPRMSGWPPALAAQRNYLQSLAEEVAGKGIYVGMLFVGALIVGSAAAEHRVVEAAGLPVPEQPSADPADLAELLWTMHQTGKPRETLVPEGFFDGL
ncbi:SDR family NAD(P)-dependent oxidoreductase [Amycolatopsis sp. NPDC059027]|uniref:SDR family NAD(P)-dependent oxidoreductase n=1 Tax=Amycolatopsis sp. NPDC059027 TaxID=3346709 RepID=UPI00366B1D15